MYNRINEKANFNIILIVSRSCWNFYEEKKLKRETKKSQLANFIKIIWKLFYLNKLFEMEIHDDYNLQQ